MKKRICILCTLVCIVGTLAMSGCSLEHTPIDANSGATPGSQPAKTPSPSPVVTVCPSAAPAADTERKLHNVTGYVISVEGDTVYVDLENSGERKYYGEGNDRAVAFDFSGATIEQSPALPGDAPRANPIRPCVTVDITYYEENSKLIATRIHSDNEEKAVIP